MCIAVHIRFPPLLLRSPLTTLFKIATLYCICSIICPLDAPHFFMLFSAPLFRTDINGLPYYSGFLLCVASRRPDDLKEESWDIYLPNSLLTESSRGGLFPLSEITVFVRRFLHTILCLSLLWWFLHPFDPSSLRGNNWILPYTILNDLPLFCPQLCK